jgi:hypothetical protein
VASFDLVYTDDHDAPEKQAFALSLLAGNVAPIANAQRG